MHVCKFRFERIWHVHEFAKIPAFICWNRQGRVAKGFLPVRSELPGRSVLSHSRSDLRLRSRRIVYNDAINHQAVFLSHLYRLAPFYETN